MATELNTEEAHDLIFKGAKEAIDLEVQRLRDEGRPIFVWKGQCVEDICSELRMAENGRLWFLIATGLLIAVSIVCAMLSGMIDKWASDIFLKSLVMFTGIACFGMYAIGAWYGAKRTRRHCLIFMAMIFPLLTYLIVSWYVTGFFK